MCNFRYVLFDLDGTISDTSEGIYNCVYYVADKLGYERPREEDMPKFIGPPLHYSFTQICGFTPEHAVEMTEKYRERYRVTGYLESRLYDGIYELLEELKSRGYKLATASSKPLHLCTSHVRRHLVCL